MIHNKPLSSWEPPNLVPASPDGTNRGPRGPFFGCTVTTSQSKPLKETYTLTVGLLDTDNRLRPLFVMSFRVWPPAVLRIKTSFHTEAMLQRAALVEAACQWGGLEGPLPNPAAGDGNSLPTQGPKEMAIHFLHTAPQNPAPSLGCPGARQLISMPT